MAFPSYGYGLRIKLTKTLPSTRFDLNFGGLSPLNADFLRYDSESTTLRGTKNRQSANDCRFAF